MKSAKLLTIIYFTLFKEKNMTCEWGGRRDIDPQKVVAQSVFNQSRKNPAQIHTAI